MSLSFLCCSCIRCWTV